MASLKEQTAATQEQSSFLVACRQTLPPIFRHPATWILTALWVISTAYLAVLGKIAFSQILFVVASVIMILLTIPLTQGAPPAAWEMPATYSRSRLWWQIVLTVLSLGIITLVVVIGDLASSSSLFAALHAPIFQLLLVLIFEIALPIGLVMWLGARRQELGFTRGYRTWRTTALLSAIPVLLIVFGVASGKISLLSVIVRAVLLVLIAGLPEEISFRGILMTRLIRLVGTGWGIAISALIFALLHVGTDIVQAKSTALLVVLATTISAQMGGGIALAVALQRSRSLIPGVISHSLTDVAVPVI
jgi:membrane protease YdiL (CAAX protease family)